MQYEQIAERFRVFLTNYEEYSQEYNMSIKHYIREAEKMKVNKRSTMYIDCRHLQKMNELEFLEEIYSEYFKLEPYLKKGLKQFMYD